MGCASSATTEPLVILSWSNRLLIKNGQKQEELYQRNKIKKARLRGECYISYKNECVAARQLRACTCRKKCTEKIRDEEKQEVFKHFYEIPSKNEQDMFLQGLIICKEV
nr:unnamed protein product [Callosobruchus chinensis]